MNPGGPRMTSRLEYLDSVRGMAALAVVVGHYLVGFGDPSFVPGWLWGTPFSIVRDGFAAVAMFFVLSGLVLSLKPLRSEQAFESWRDLAAFYVGRVARILLPFVAVVWLSAALQTFVYRPRVTTPPASPWLLSFWSTDQTVGNLIKQSFLFVPLGTDRLVPQDWTLTVEMNLSLCMPFLILLAARSVFALLCLAPAFIHEHWFVMPFAMGVGLARYFDRLREAPLFKRPEVFSGLLAGGLLLYSCRYSKGLFPAAVSRALSERWSWHVSEVGALMILVAIIGSPWLQHGFSARPLTYLGRISYSVYLWHFAVLLCVTPRILGVLNDAGIASPDAARGLGLLVTLAVVIGVSDLSFRFIERPSIDAGKRVSALLRPRRAGPIVG